MRKPIALFAGLVIAAFSFVASEAAEVQIGDFVFGCKTSDGQVRKPQFGDMSGVFYTDIRGQEKACKDAVKRMIANCHQHTRFLRPADNRKYPECLPVFQEQANECAAFFRQEIAKCSGHAGQACIKLVAKVAITGVDGNERVFTGSGSTVLEAVSNAQKPCLRVATDYDKCVVKKVLRQQC